MIMQTSWNNKTNMDFYTIQTHQHQHQHQQCNYSNCDCDNILSTGIGAINDSLFFPCFQLYHSTPFQTDPYSLILGSFISDVPQIYRYPFKHPLTPKSAKGPSQRASWATRHLSRLARVCGVLQPPRSAFSSASSASSSGVAPPVTSVRMRVRMLSLKYVCGMRESDEYL